MDKKQFDEFVRGMQENGYSDDDIVNFIREKGIRIEEAPAPRGDSMQEVMFGNKDLAPVPQAFIESGRGAGRAVGDIVGAGDLGADLGAGFGESLYSMGTLSGPRQLLNKLMGDEEDLSELNQAEAARRAYVDATRSGEGGAVTAGRIAGSAGIPMAAAATLPSKLAGGLNAVTRTALGGSIGGAASGAMSSLTPEEEDAGDRATNTVAGGLIGAALPGVLRGAHYAGTKLKEVAGRLLPDDALEDFLRREANTTRSTNVNETYESVAGKAGARYDEAYSDYQSRLRAVEGDSSLPPVTMNNSSAVEIGPEISAQLADEPRIRRVVSAVSDRANTSIVIPNGAGGYSPVGGNIGFDEARQAVRDINKKISLLERGERTDTALVSKLREVRDAIEADLSDWAGKSRVSGDAYAAAKGLDAEYRDVIGPMRNKDTPVGGWRDSGYEERTFNNQFMAPDRGSEVKELMERVPGTEDEVRQLYASKLLPGRGAEQSVTMMRPNSTRDVLFTDEQKAYMDELASKLRQPDRDTMLRQAGRMADSVSGDFLEKALRGIHRYGNAPEPYKMSAIKDALRMYGASQGYQQLMKGE